MKRALELLSLIFAVTVFSGGLCHAQKDTGSTTGTDPEIARKNYNTVVPHLDEGGDMLVFANLEGLLEEGVDQLLAGVSLTAGTDPGAGKLHQSLTRLPDFLKKKGLYSVDGCGFSSVPIGDGQNKIKFFIQRDLQAARLPLWRGMLSIEPSRIKALDFVPANAVMVRAGLGEVDRLWGIVKDGMHEIAPQEVSAKFDQSLAAAAQQLGVTVDKLIESIGKEGLLSFHLSKDKMIALPAKQALMMPAPSALIVIKLDDSTLPDLIQAKMQALGGPNGSPVKKVQVSGTEINVLNMPLPVPVPLQITYAEHEGYFLLGTTEQLVTEAIQSFKGGNGLVAQSRFKSEFKGLPMKNNGLMYFDRELGELISEIQKKMMLSDISGQGSETFKRNLNKIMSAREPYSAAMVIINLKDGVLVKGKSTMGGSEIITATSVAPVGLMAAIAVPSYFKARSTSQRNACINNLRQLDAAKEMWALEKNKANGEQPVANEVFQYIKGAKMPICPEGGEYTLNPIGTDPECSVHGTLSQQVGF